MKYLILSYDCCPFETEAKHVVEAVENFAEYCGERSSLFCTAMKGVITEVDAIKMFNHFSNFHITDLYEVSAHYTEETKCNDTNS